MSNNKVPTQANPTHSTIEIIRGMAGDLRDLVTAHVDSAQLEFREELRQLRRALLRGAIAAAAIGVALLVLTHGLAIFLADAADWPLWGGYSLVGVATLVAALALAWSTRSQIPDTVPEQSIERARKGARYLANQARASFE
jgi:uncharacterized membrane protein YqjE